MAEKRMFTKKIIDSDAFLDMPLSAQALYFHLNMRADDDGFVNNPMRVTNYVNASKDDLKLLLTKRFIIGFESGVIVIKHWRMHNTLKSDRYIKTDYQEEFKMLIIKENKSYTERIEDSPALPEDTGNDVPCLPEPEWNQNGSEMVPQNSIGLGLVESSNLTNSNKLEFVCRTKDVRRVIEAWNAIGLNQLMRISPDTKRGQMTRARIKEYGTDAVVEAINRISKSSFLRGQNNKGWMITYDWFIKPNNYIKVAEGNYDDGKAQPSPGNQPLPSYTSGKGAQPAPGDFKQPVAPSMGEFERRAMEQFMKRKEERK